MSQERRSPPTVFLCIPCHSSPVWFASHLQIRVNGEYRLHTSRCVGDGGRHTELCALVNSFILWSVSSYQARTNCETAKITPIQHSWIRQLLMSSATLIQFFASPMTSLTMILLHIWRGSMSLLLKLHGFFSKTNHRSISTSGSRDITWVTEVILKKNVNLLQITAYWIPEVITFPLLLVIVF